MKRLIKSFQHFYLLLLLKPHRSCEFAIIFSNTEKRWGFLSLDSSNDANVDHKLSWMKNCDWNIFVRHCYICQSVNALEDHLCQLSFLILGYLSFLTFLNGNLNSNSADFVTASNMLFSTKSLFARLKVFSKSKTPVIISFL